MAEENSQPKNFLATLPGILGGIAAIMAAGVGYLGFVDAHLQAKLGGGQPIIKAYVTNYDIKHKPLSIEECKSRAHKSVLELNGSVVTENGNELQWAEYLIDDQRVEVNCNCGNQEFVVVAGFNSEKVNKTAYALQSEIFREQ
jgi:hypothetical protein